MACKLESLCNVLGNTYFTLGALNTTYICHLYDSARRRMKKQICELLENMLLVGHPAWKGVEYRHQRPADSL